MIARWSTAHVAYGGIAVAWNVESIKSESQVPGVNHCHRAALYRQTAGSAIGTASVGGTGTTGRIRSCHQGQNPVVLEGLPIHRGGSYDNFRPITHNAILWRTYDAFILGCLHDLDTLPA